VYPSSRTTRNIGLCPQSAQIPSGKCAGGFVPQSKDDVKWLLGMGMKFITYNVDSDILYRYVNEVVEWFESEA